MTEESLNEDVGAKPADTTNPEAGLVARIQGLAEALQARYKEAEKGKKALDALLKRQTLVDGEDLDKGLRGLRKLSLEQLGLDAERAELLGAVESFVERRKMKTRMQFLGELQGLARVDGLEVTRLSDTPLTVYISPLTVEVDFDKDRAHLLYGRETFEEVRLSPKNVIEARKKASETIRRTSVESAEFFDRLDQAYQFVLMTRGEPRGTRVDLVDLLVPLAVLSAGRDAWRKKGIAALAEYPRYLLAYQLNKLRRDGLLEKNGRRVDLGTATGGSTKNKKDVLFIPTAGTEGQYYLSIRIGD